MMSVAAREGAQVRSLFSCSPGGLRYAPTTGYYLTALQAETHLLAWF